MQKQLTVPIMGGYTFSFGVSKEETPPMPERRTRWTEDLAKDYFREALFLKPRQRIRVFRSYGFSCKNKNVLGAQEAHLKQRFKLKI